MKTAIYLFIALLIVAGCSKPSTDDSVTPDRGRRMAGTYEVSSMAMQYGSEPKEVIPIPLILEGKQLLSAEIGVERVAEGQVNVKMKLIVDESIFGGMPGMEDTQLEQLMEIRNNGSGYDLYEDGKKVARFDDDMFVVQAEQQKADGTLITTELTARKKR